MRILRVNDDHYVAETSDELARFALVLLNQRLTMGQLPEAMVDLARSVCLDEDGSTAFALLQRTDDVALIPAEVL